MKVWFIILVLCSVWFSGVECKGAQTSTEDWQQWEVYTSLDDVDRVLSKESHFSIKEYVTQIMEGQAAFSWHDLAAYVKEGVADQWSKEQSTLFRILALGIMAGIFAHFSGAFGNENIGGTGSYIVFLLMFSIVTKGFLDVFSVAKNTLDQLVEFMKVIVPSLSLALCAGTSTTGSVLYYQAMLMAISVLEGVLLNILLPGVQIYFYMGILNQLSDNHFSKLWELTGRVLAMAAKVLFGILIGYQGIQGMLLPVMDRVKNNALLQSAKGLPGVGNSVESVADTFYAVGLLVKSALGIGGVIAIVLLCLYPLIRILVFTFTYHLAEAFVQPVSSGRAVALLQVCSESGKLLGKFVLGGALMFMLSIVILLACTNFLGGI